MIYRNFKDIKLSLLGFGAMRLPLNADGTVDEAATKENDTPKQSATFITFINHYKTLTFFVYGLILHPIKLFVNNIVHDVSCFLHNAKQNPAALLPGHLLPIYRWLYIHPTVL